MKLPKPEFRKPQLNGSAPKAPAFLTDLYYDLRDRRLLLPLALVLVAIAAVPFLLGSKPKPVPAPPAGGIAAAVGSAGTAASRLTVVEAQPGLRDYRKRLKHRSPTDPFKQRYTGLPPSAQVQTSSGGGSSEASGGEESVTVTETTTTETTEVGEGGGSGGGQSSAPQYELVVDVQVSHSEKTAGGDERLSKPQVRRNIPVLTQLPSEKNAVVTLLGANFKTQRLVFLVSHAVKAISGDYACATRGEICELLEVEPGIELEYIYEPTGVRYAIKVTGVNVVPLHKRKRSNRSSRGNFVLSRPETRLKPHSFTK